MAQSTRITDGTTTLTLDGSGAYVGANYWPTSKADSADITETFDLTLEGTEGTIRDAVREVERLLEQARRQAEHLADRVYIEFQPGAASGYFRSEILEGTVLWSGEPVRHSLESSSQNVVQVAVIVTRRNYWEGAEEELYLASAVTARTTGGVTINNNDNAGTANYVTLLDTDTKGSLPAPIKLRITNAAGSSLSWSNIYVGVNAYSDPTNIDCWLLGSEAVAGDEQTWLTAIDHSSNLYIFNLGSTLLSKTKGRFFRVIATFSSAPADAHWKAHAGAYIGGVFIPIAPSGDEVYGAGEVVDLGAFRLPPGGWNVGTAAGAIKLTARTASSGGATLDHVLLMATDSYTHVQQIGFTVTNSESLEINGIDGGVYYLSAGGDKYPIYRQAQPVSIFPDRTQRIYILVSESGNYVPTRAMTVRAWYRPRYANL